jgi:uncharacterized Zn finger protein
MAKKRRSSYYDDYWPSYEHTAPIRVKDGIKAKSQSGRFVKSWWADRWIEALTPLMDSGRLSRGRSYARHGQVLEIKVTPGQVAARVQGSRRTPYKIDIRLKPLADDDWERVFDALASQALFAAHLLSGEMPAEIEQVFDAVEAPLFPTTRGDLQTSCSCPDYANPCKHIAAVYYLLGERFDENPFLLLELRGRTQEQVAAALRERRAGETQGAGEAAGAAGPVESAASPPLADALERYWDLGGPAGQVALHIAAPEVELALLKQLGLPAFLEAAGAWRQLERIYAGVTERALEVAFADRPISPSAPADES